MLYLPFTLRAFKMIFLGVREQVGPLDISNLDQANLRTKLLLLRGLIYGVLSHFVVLEEQLGSSKSATCYKLLPHTTFYSDLK